MRILLDTHAFLWFILDDDRLPAHIRFKIEDLQNEVFVSIASFWETSLKYGIGKLVLPAEPQIFLPEERKVAGIDLIHVSEAEACLAHSLPSIHKDPFDRMLIIQAIQNEMVIATVDPLIKKYAVETIW